MLEAIRNPYISGLYFGSTFNYYNLKDSFGSIFGKVNLAVSLFNEVAATSGRAPLPSRLSSVLFAISFSPELPRSFIYKSQADLLVKGLSALANIAYLVSSVALIYLGSPATGALSLSLFSLNYAVDHGYLPQAVETPFSYFTTITSYASTFLLGGLGGKALIVGLAAMNSGLMGKCFSYPERAVETDRATIKNQLVAVAREPQKFTLQVNKNYIDLPFPEKGFISPADGQARSPLEALKMGRESLARSLMSQFLKPFWIKLNISQIAGFGIEQKGEEFYEDYFTNFLWKCHSEDHMIKCLKAYYREESIQWAERENASLAYAPFEDIARALLVDIGALQIAL